MTGRSLGYVVVTYNQASGNPEITDAGLYDEPLYAREAAAEEQARTDAVGRGERHAVAEVREVDDGYPAGAA